MLIPNNRIAEFSETLQQDSVSFLRMGALISSIRVMCVILLRHVRSVMFLSSG